MTTPITISMLYDLAHYQHWTVMDLFADATAIIDGWQRHYNDERPHSSLGYKHRAVFE